MKIATYNVNSINARLENLTAWLTEAAPDVVLVQEIKSEYNNFPFFELRAAGYNAQILGQKSYNGVAVLSKTPVKVTCEGLPGFADANARYLEAEIKHNDQSWRVASIYLPNGNPPYNNAEDDSKYLYKQQWMDALLRHAETLQKLPQPVILGGDFNVILTDNDVYDPKRFVGNALTRPEVRQKLTALGHLGFYDAFRTLHPDSSGYTFWDYAGNSLNADFGMRIDYLFLNAPAADRLLSCTVDKTPRRAGKPSDHTVLIAEFRND